jgi:hypothetical protein
MTVPPSGQPFFYRMPVIFTYQNAVSFLTNTVDQNLNLCVPFPYPDLMGMEKISLTV